ncbi:MAG: lipid-A-disaccharide synthase [Bacteroidia bacterium]|jgi:lipid-A-disaccharide synthase|nr:lipid-A-disaccharide synthase [Bacteroidia bacterium]
MKYFIIAGEASGDLHGSNLMKAICEEDANAQFQFWGGDAMAAQAPGLLKHYKDTSIYGFIEIIRKLRSIKNYIATCKQHIEAFQPDVVVLIDYPGFNMRIAEFCKKNGYKTAYYISPKIWAWNEARGKKLEKYVDTLMLIFEFEVSYFKKWKVNSVFVGNPLLDAIAQFQPNPKFRQQNQLDDKPIIALLPGSRKQEITTMLPKMIEATASFSNYQLVVAGAPAIDAAFYQPYLSNQIKVVYNQTYDVLKQSELAVVCSGTATLETALFNIPQVCGYIANPITYWLAMLVIKVKYISLVNLNLGRYCIEELLQSNFSTSNLQRSLSSLMPGKPERERMLADYAELRNILGGEGASKRAAAQVIALAKAIKA